MDLRARLEGARRLARNGRHQEALDEFLWFHEHALEHSRSVSAVRLSYALFGWRDLAAVYPPAREALERTRERDAARLLAGDGTFEQFHDVVSIDEALGEPERAHALLEKLLDEQPTRAASWADIVLDSVLAARNHTLAQRIIPDPEARIRLQAGHLNESLGYRRHRFIGKRFIRLHIDMYVRQVLPALAMLEAIGLPHEAQRLRRLAGDLIPMPAVRRTVEAGLCPGAVPPSLRGVAPWIRKRISPA